MVLLPTSVGDIASIMFEIKLAGKSMFDFLLHQLIGNNCWHDNFEDRKNENAFWTSISSWIQSNSVKTNSSGPAVFDHYNQGSILTG
jgi:hypothetical protein